MSPEDENEEISFDSSNERIIEGASSPDQLNPSMTSSLSNNTNQLWGIRISIQGLDIIPEEFRFVRVDLGNCLNLSSVTYSANFHYSVVVKNLGQLSHFR